jgi:hypothetical protein
MAYPFDSHGKTPLTDSGSWGLLSCHLQTRHNYEISYPYEWGERLYEFLAWRFFFFFFGFCPSTTVPLTRYVRRVRELRQNVRFPFSHADSDPTVCLLLYHITRICRYGRFSKSIRPDEVGACQLRAPPTPFKVITRVIICALCRKIVNNREC